MALIICCSPAASEAAETLSSLRFGTRAKGLMTSVQVLNKLYSTTACSKADVPAPNMSTHILKCAQHVIEQMPIQVPESSWLRMKGMLGCGKGLHGCETGTVAQAEASEVPCSLCMGRSILRVAVCSQAPTVKRAAGSDAGQHLEAALQANKELREEISILKKALAVASLQDLQDRSGSPAPPLVSSL